MMEEQEQPKRILLSWSDVDALIDQLLPQIRGAFDALVLVTRGGIVPRRVALSEPRGATAS